MRSLFLGLALVLGACYVQTDFIPSTTVKFSERPADCYLDLVYFGEPPFPYVVIGVMTNSMGSDAFALVENGVVAMNRLRAQACRVGAHGLFRASTHGSGTRDEATRSTDRAALAFVYVDADGHPMSPPTGSQLIIHPGGTSSALITAPKSSPRVVPVDSSLRALPGVYVNPLEPVRTNRIPNSRPAWQ